MQQVFMKLLELLEKSVILQGLITAGVVGATVYLWCIAAPVPDGLLAAFWAVLGYWFGTKTQYLLHKSRESRE